MRPMATSEVVAVASDGVTARLNGQWVHGKKYFFCRYLDIMTHGVGRKWQGKLAVVDLFSGPGRSIVRGSQEEVDGSPALALNYEFARYIFVDIPEVLSCLKKRLAGHPKFSQIAFIEGDCNEVIEEVRFASPADHLTLAFIDPTGLQIRFRTIQRLVQNRRVALLMTLQFGMVIRLNLNQYIKAEGAKLTAFLGNAEWRKDASEGGSASHVLRRIKNRYLHHLRQVTQLSEMVQVPVLDSSKDMRSGSSLARVLTPFSVAQESSQFRTFGLDVL